MDFFDNLKKVFVDTAQTAVKKSGEVVETTKIKYAIFDIQNEIERIYAEIGEEIYESFKTDKDVIEIVNEKCRKIDEKKQAVAELSQKLGDIKNILECPKCHKACKTGMEFCPYCGSRLSDEEKVFEGEVL